MPEVKKWAMDVRMSFQKTGMAKFISHLDTVRCITRAMKRACVPIWFTEGFNPHAFLTFAMPLSLGFESLCETVDFRLMEEIDLKYPEYGFKKHKGYGTKQHMDTLREIGPCEIHRKSFIGFLDK